MALIATAAQAIAAPPLSCLSHRPSAARAVAASHAPAIAAAPEIAPPAPGAATAVAIASGSNHLCARINDGTALCWGDDAMGQTGDMTFAAHALPARVAGQSDIAELALGSEHTCARLEDGTVRCWGANDVGQLGDGTTARSASPRTVIGVGGAVRIAAGASHSCVIAAAGAVLCWGFDGARASGAALRPHANATVRAAEVPGIRDAVDLALGDGHACARRADGSLACWGARSAGVADLAKDSPAVAIAAFGERTCAARVDGSVACFDVFTRATERVDVATVLGAPPVAIALGFEMACVRSAAGAVACWGKNDWGELGDGDTRSRREPALVSGLAPASQIAVGAGHACALERDGAQIRCWGSNASGELGRDPHIATSEPARVTSLEAAQAMALGPGRSCAIGKTHAVSCWGVPLELDAQSPVRVDLEPKPLAGATDAADLALGGWSDESFLCLATTDGRARCLGANELGQLGDGTRSSRDELAEVTDLRDVVEVAAGQRHACALTKGGLVACWGEGTRGDLGGDATSARSKAPRAKKAKTKGQKTKKEPKPEIVSRDLPHVVRGLSNVASIAAGFDFTCARLRDGTARCWGANRSGQLGDGTGEPHSSPVRVRDLTGIEELTAGDAHACARLRDGTVRCWGSGTSGQIGDGTDAVTRLAAAKVHDLANVVHVAAGGHATCALLRDGAVRCWGKLPELGGDSGIARSPVPIHGVDAAQEITVGGDHACATDDHGLTRCWGANASGELGDGQRLLFSASPLPITW